MSQWYKLAMNDEYYGLGGSYVADPKTGKRKLIERTEEKAEPAAPAPTRPDDDETE